MRGAEGLRYRRDVAPDTPNRIVPGLWMSGSRAPIAAGDFDRVLTLCAAVNEKVAVPEGTDALVWRIPDAELDDPGRVQDWARRITTWIDDGDEVLVRCAAGLNRSGLVIARTLIEQGLTPTDAVLLVREQRRADALNNPWFVEWLRHEGSADGEAPRIPLPREVVGPAPFVRRFGLDTPEVVSTAIAAVVSGSLFARYGDPYLARGVVGDLLGFAVLSVPLLWQRIRFRHEAMVCLVGIGVVHATGADWPLQVSTAAWWAASAAGLGGYLTLRWLRLPSTRAGRRTRRGRRTASTT